MINSKQLDPRECTVMPGATGLQMQLHPSVILAFDSLDDVTQSAHHNMCWLGLTTICWIVFKISRWNGFCDILWTRLTSTFDLLNLKVDRFMPSSCGSLALNCKTTCSQVWSQGLNGTNSQVENSIPPASLARRMHEAQRLQ